MKSVKSSNRVKALSLLLLGAWAGLPGAARADNIDQELYKQAPRLMEYVQKQGYRNVGVLKFRVQRGARGESFEAGPLNVNMATRLENVLILANDVKQPVGILRDASKVAAAAKLQEGYVTPSGRRSLFEHKFPLAWGKETVKPDAFMTGLVTISRDNRQARVTIEAFDPKAEGLHKVQDFSVATDRTILADAGKSFLVSLRDADHGGREDEVAAESASAQELTFKSPTHSAARLIDLEVRYNGKLMVRSVNDSGEERVPAPAVGDTVQFRIKNISKVKVGVLLGVNGVNTLFEEVIAERLPPQCTKWILAPGEGYDINGFYLDRAAGEKNVKLFKVTDDLTRLEIYGDKLGMIHLGVFCEGDAKQELKISGPSLRGLSRRQLTEHPPQSVAELQYRLVRQMLKQKPPEKLAEDLQEVRARALTALKSSPLVKKGGAIVPEDDPVGTTELTRVEFKNPQLMMEQNIRYFNPKSPADK